MTKVGRLDEVVVSVELAVLVSSQILVVRQRSRDPQDSKGELQEKLNLDHEETVEEVAVIDKRREGHEDVVPKVDAGGEEAEDDQVNQRTPRWVDNGSMGVVVLRKGNESAVGAGRKARKEMKKETDPNDEDCEHGGDQR